MMESKWRKPAPAFAKINVDFAALVRSDSYGVGTIIRNDAGEFLAACSQVPGLVDPYIGESMAAKSSMLFALELGLDQVKLEVDAKNVWKSITKGENDRSYACNIVRDIYVYSSWFRNFRVKFAPRQCNKVADVLLSCAKNIQQETWLDLPPSFIVDVTFI